MLANVSRAKTRNYPPQVQIAVNINIVGLDMKNESTADARFVFTVNYTPSIAQLSVKGRAQVIGEKGEISKMIDEHKQNEPPPVAIIQAVSSIALAEAILLSKSLGIPHHFRLWAFRQNKCKHSNSKDRESPSRATQPNSNLELLEPSKILEVRDVSKKLDFLGRDLNDAKLQFGLSPQCLNRQNVQVICTLTQVSTEQIGLFSTKILDPS